MKPRRAATLDSLQIIALTAVFMMSAQLLFFPSAMAKAAGPRAWLIPPVGLAIALVPVVFMLHGLLRYHPGRSLTEMAEASLGKWPGKVVGLLFSLFCLLLCSLVTRDIMDFTAIAILPGTPLAATGVLFLGVVVYGVYGGSEVLARMSVLIGIVVIVTVLIMPLALTRDMVLLRARPVFAGGLAPLLSGAIPSLGWFGEIWVMGQFTGMLDQPRRALRNLMAGSLIALVLLEVTIVTTLMVFGSQLTSLLMYPSYTLVQEISFGEFMERVEILLIAVWLSAMLIKASACLWAGCSGLTQVLGLAHDRTLLVPAAALVLTLTLLWQSFVELVSVTNQILSQIFVPLELGLPALMLIGSWWGARRKRRRTQVATE